MVVLLINGLDCEHCFGQVRAYADKFVDEKAQLVCVAAASSNRQQAYVSKERMFVDSDHELFKTLKCYKTYPMHGTFVFGKSGDIVFKKIDNLPFMNVSLVNDVIANL